PQMVRQLADRFPSLGDQYPLFAEFHDLNNASIAKFLGVAEKVDRIRDVMLRGNALGIVQAEIGLWQILARQGQIPRERLNASWQEMLTPFSSVRSSVELYDAARASFANLERTATGKAGHSQDEVIALLAAPAQDTPEGQQVQQELAHRMRSVLQDQRLVSLDTLFGLGDGLTQLVQGQPVSENLLPLAQELREFEFPRPLFTSGERVEYVPGLVENTHTGLQTRIDLTKTIKKPGSRKELIEARGVLAALVRDTLVGLNYAYYEPPAAQMLHHNPLFVRSHDFSGVTWNSPVEAWKTSHL